MNKLTHVDDSGRIRMVDVGKKPIRLRIAIAEGRITLSPETLDLIDRALIKKGDVMTAAEIAGIQAAKRTAELIPLCHPLITDHVSVSGTREETGIRIHAEVRCMGKTGAEMEALTAVTVALLTIYDMCKAVDKQMVIHEVHLIKKEKRPCLTDSLLNP